MKLLVLVGLLTLTTQSALAVLTANEPGGHCRTASTWETRDACQILWWTTSFPIAVIQSEADIEMEDMMLQFSDEINDLVESKEATEKLSSHFGVSVEEMAELGISLQNSEVGLSFESLTEALK